MTLYFISDTVTAPIARELQKLLPGLSITERYEEDLIAALMQWQETATDAVYFIHSDQYFRHKPAAWQMRYLDTVHAFTKRQTAPVLLSNQFDDSFEARAWSDYTGRQAGAIERYHQQLQACLSLPNLLVFDLAELVMNIGASHFYQYNLGHLYQMPYTKPAVKAIAGELQQQLQWLRAEEKKVIVLDCDNTLWKGIIGEEGIDGIACDNNADGITWYHFQQFLKSRLEEGFLLCLCSKNNEADVEAVFRSRRMPLQWNDFIIKKINWQDKHTQLQAIAQELNVGINSLIFIDDNLFELNATSTLLPGLSTLHFTGDYKDFLQLTRSFYFRKRKILTEDSQRTALYRTEQDRSRLLNETGDMESFIESLDIQMDISVNDPKDLERLSQLTGKTNQFNFNKQPYTTRELEEVIASGWKLFALRVSDKFGDYGLVGLIMVRPAAEDHLIENYLMSCRALGKRIEEKFFHAVHTQLQNESAAPRQIVFKPTDRNQPAQNFLTILTNDYQLSTVAGNIPERL
jgi:FkbH-like protein